MTTLALSLVSHTNAGKTTLARTLLQRDVGEVRDAPHVTEFAEDHLLLRSAAGDELRLWDTPGFGDTVRLLARLRRDGTALGWFLSEVWDRWRDRPFWATQQALRHVRERSDAVLYLVNAAESPEAARHVAAEMQLLAWMDKPVVVLLNQLGAVRQPHEEAADVERWQQHLAPWPHVAQVLPLDAFARCWVQEGALWRALRAALPPAKAEAMARLEQAWLAARLEAFEASARVLAGTVARVACTRVPMEGPQGLGDSLRQLSGWLGRRLWPAGGDGAGDAASAAQARLAAQLDADVRASTAELLSLHGLGGQAEGEILARVARQIELGERVDEQRAAVLGGVLTGALAGLKADIATGGLTLGGGMLAGGLLGALGAAGVARGLNVIRGGGPAWAGWSAEAMGPIVEAAVLRYLAVAHFGRGRGQWAQGESPPHWAPLVQAVVRERNEVLAGLWKSRGTVLDAAGEAARLEPALRPVVGSILREVLQRLYPQAWTAAAAAPGTPSAVAVDGAQSWP